MNVEDYLIICGVYIDLISDRQCHILFNMISHLDKTFIPGIMPYGEHFWYTYESKLDGYMFDELKGRELNAGVKAMIMVFISRILLREEGIK